MDRVCAHLHRFSIRYSSSLRAGTFAGTGHAHLTDSGLTSCSLLQRVAMASTSSVGTAKSPPSTPPPAAGSSSSSRNRRRTPPLSRSARNRPPSFAIGSPPSQPCFLPAVGLSVGEEKQDPFDFSAVRSALKQLEASPKSAGVKSNEEKEINSGLAVTVEVGTGSKRTRTGIQVSLAVVSPLVLPPDPFSSRSHFLTRCSSRFLHKRATITASTLALAAGLGTTLRRSSLSSAVDGCRCVPFPSL